MRITEKKGRGAMLVRYCICGCSLEITGERLYEAAQKLRNWNKAHWYPALEEIKARPGHGPCSAEECYRARGRRRVAGQDKVTIPLEG